MVFGFEVVDPPLYLLEAAGELAVERASFRRVVAPDPRTPPDVSVEPLVRYVAMTSRADWHTWTTTPTSLFLSATYVGSPVTGGSEVPSYQCPLLSHHLFWLVPS